jgi:hypothetical protein
VELALAWLLLLGQSVRSFAIAGDPAIETNRANAFGWSPGFVHDPGASIHGDSMLISRMQF